MTRRKGHDPVHTFRAPTALVVAAREVAQESGENLSDVVRRALEEYVKRNRQGLGV